VELARGDARRDGSANHGERARHELTGYPHHAELLGRLNLDPRTEKHSRTVTAARYARAVGTVGGQRRPDVPRAEDRRLGEVFDGRQDPLGDHLEVALAVNPNEQAAVAVQ